jgi:hypothetical protein
VSRWFPRPISAEEAAFVRTALQRAPVGADRTALFATIDKLVVVDRCKCGCPSVNFESSPSSRGIVVEGLAKSVSGAEVGFIVWGDESGVAGLEIYEKGPGGLSERLPAVDSIETFPGWLEA